jgi:hypothetical protein
LIVFVGLHTVALHVVDILLAVVRHGSVGELSQGRALVAEAEPVAKLFPAIRND